MGKGFNGNAASFAWSICVAGPLCAAALCLCSPAQTLPLVQSSQQQDAFAYPLPYDRGTSGLAQSLRHLHTRASMLQINAHPDDEDGGMLTFESRQAGADVSLLSLNRGEGGQNVMTADFWDALGILRTQEHLAANRYYGDHLYYTRVADFGFSKTIEETLGQWGHERVLADAVRVVRAVRPMVVTSVFAGYVSDGHGHHQTAGLIAQEVFNAAADPQRFPEQIREGLRPWAPLKMYARVPFARVVPGKGIFDYATNKYAPVAFRNYITGEAMNGVPAETVSIPEGDYNPLLGLSSLQIAREGLNQQRSQIGGTGIPPAGRFDSPYHLYASRMAHGALPTHEDTLFDGIDTKLPAIAGYLPVAEAALVRVKLQAIAAQVDQATILFDPHNPAASAPSLAKGLGLTRTLIAELAAAAQDDGHYNALHELRVKQSQFETALHQSLGITLLAVAQPVGTPAMAAGPLGPTDAASAAALSATSSTTAIPGQSLSVAVHVANQGREIVLLQDIQLRPNTPGLDWQFPPSGAAVPQVAPGGAIDTVLLTTVPQAAPLTSPYFSRPTLAQSYYDLQDRADLTLPTMPYPLSAAVSYTFQGIQNTLTEVVQTARREVGQGVVVHPLLIAPAISVRLTPRAGIVPLTAPTLPLDVTLHSSVKGPADGTLTLELPNDWVASPASATFHTSRDNEDATLHFEVTPRDLKQKTYTITAAATYNGQTYTQGFTSIGYPGIRPYPQYLPASDRITGVDVKVAPDLRIGYVMGTGDDLPQSLNDLGIHVVQLAAEDVAAANLSSYDAIVLGIRTYAARPELRTFNKRLLDYVKQGGVVITEYQTAEYDRNYGPYPISVPSDAEKVVEETAPVQLLKPDDPTLTWPNHISTADFNGWVEERGHGFPRSFDSHYVALTETHDKDQDPQTGGLVYAGYGKGYYVYLAYAFFRQMPEGVPGSFRIMANLLSMRQNPALTH